MDRYIIVSGAGKSGSKRILKILDLCPATHCRCESNSLPGSPFAALPTRDILWPEIDDRMEAAWDGAVGWAARCVGERDHLPTPPKRHLRPHAQRLQLYRLLKHRRLRTVLSILSPSFRGPEWPVPGWLVDPDALERAVLVLKTGPVPCWVPWVLKHRPQAAIVDVVRHPGGFLHSFKGRWLSNATGDGLAQENRARLRTIAQLEPRWGNCWNGIDRMSGLEAEMWYWRYVYETTYAAGSCSDRYCLVRDEDVIEHPQGVAKRLYDFCGVESCSYAERYLARVAPHWRSRAAPWRELLTPGEVELVERVLAGSVMETWWDRDQVVSLYDYQA